MYQYLTEKISKKVTLTNKDIELCKQYFEPQIVNRNTIVEEINKIPQYLFFIASGYMRLFYYDENGDEVTTYITSPGNFIASFLSLINEKKSPENVECITDCELLRILKTDVMALIEASESFKQFSILIFEQAISSTQIRANDLATLNAEQRYKKLVDEQPEILQNIPLQYIASYLGVKSQSLSRIRRHFLL